MGAAALALALVPLVGQPAAADPAAWFPDAPVVWHEHDDGDVPQAPAPNDLQDWRMTLLLRDSLAGEVDRILALEGRQPAQDVNALDEVPCSTWFCGRNHLDPMTPAAVAAGPPGPAPRLPLRIVKGKDQGATTGFQVLDADGRRYMLKVDPSGHLGLSTGAEIVGGRFFHAAGYNVPPAFLRDLAPDELRVDPGATFNLYRVQKRPLSAARVQRMLTRVARTGDGRLRVVLVPWVPGRVLGGFDMIGRRADDPNDHIPHQHRRSLRASWVLMAWLSVLDPSAINTIDSYVEEGGRRFVRHYIFDFGAALGSSTVSVKGPHQTGSHVLEVGRTLGAFAGLGLYRRPFQDERDQWAALVAAYPSAGWFQAEGFDPDVFRSNRKVPAHVRRTDGDLYWGAKLVASFTDAQIEAVVDEARFPAPDAAWIKHALRHRRDVIARRYLRAVTAVEQPAVSADGRQLCFVDAAVARAGVRPQQLRYQVTASDGNGGALGGAELQARAARNCLAVPAADRPGSGYRVVELASRYTDGQRPAAGRPARVHLRWRASEARFVVVGLERDEGLTEDAGPALGGGVGLDGRPLPAPPAVTAPRLLLRGPQLAARAAFWPVVHTTALVESYRLFDWARAILTSDDGRLGVRPELHYTSGFRPTGGARLFYHPPAGRASARLHTAGTDTFRAELRLAAPEWLGLGAQAHWDQRPDRLYAGLGAVRQAALQAQGQGFGRYRSDVLAVQLDWLRPLGRWLRLDAGADLVRRRFDATDVRGTALTALFDPAGVPGFQGGDRLLHLGGQLQLGPAAADRDGRSLRLGLEALYGHGVAGDPSRHLRLGAETVLSVGDRDRALLLRLRGSLVEPLGSAPVSFEELIAPASSGGLRGFPEGRFRGPSAVTGALEYRWFIAFNLDAALFVDVGTVGGARFAGLSRAPLFPSAGVGLRRFDPGPLYWQAPVKDGLQIVYAPDVGWSVLLSTAAF